MRTSLVDDDASMMSEAWQSRHSERPNKTDPASRARRETLGNLSLFPAK
jgi:hypothetical protein